MPNMGYCRFQNTLADLHDCHEHLGEANSDEEKRAEEYLIELCKEIVEESE